MNTHFWKMVTLLLLSGCDLILDSGDFNRTNDPCSALGEAPISVEGNWQISGTGERSSCGDPVLDAERFELNSRGDLRIVEDQGELSLAIERDDFVFSGTLEGQCVTFATTEPNNGITFNWSGLIGDNRTIEGTFDGTGPNNCISSGDFLIIIE